MQHVGGATSGEFSRFYSYAQRVVEEEVNRFVSSTKEGYIAVSKDILRAITERIEKETSEGRWFAEERRVTRNSTEITADAFRIEILESVLFVGWQVDSNRLRQLAGSNSTYNLENGPTEARDTIRLCITLGTRQTHM
jgi:hypothetical protein